MTSREFIELWRETSRAQMGNTEQLYRDVYDRCENLVKIEQAGLSLSWNNLPENYKEKIIVLLCIKLSGGDVYDALEKLSADD